MKQVTEEYSDTFGESEIYYSTFWLILPYHGWVKGYRFKSDVSKSYKVTLYNPIKI